MVISEDNVIQIKLRMVILISGIIITVLGTLAGWQQVQINNLKDELKDEQVKVYVIKTEDVPSVIRVLSVQQSQLNTLNTIIFGKPININLGVGDSNIPPTIDRGN